MRSACSIAASCRDSARRLVAHRGGGRKAAVS